MLLILKVRVGTWNLLLVLPYSNYYKFCFIMRFLNFIIGMVLDLFKNQCNNDNKTNGKRYSKEMRQFALALHYHSPRAYNFCR